MVHRQLLGIFVLALAGALGHAADAPRASGIRTGNMDPSVRPQADFFRYQNGTWLKSTEIPADRSAWSIFSAQREAILLQLRGLVEEAGAAHPAQGTDARRLSDYYASFMDEARIEQRGLAPLDEELRRIAALKDKGELPVLLAHLETLGVSDPYFIYVHQDNKDATRYVADLQQGGLGMPDRDYYLKADDAKLAATKAKYLGHVGKVLGLAGDAAADAHARAVVDFETELARAQWTQVELRDPVKGYNKVALDGLPRLAAGFDWNAYLRANGVADKTGYVIVGQPGYLKRFAALAATAPLDTWKAYLSVHLIDAYGEYLSKAFADEHFDFFDKTLYDQPEMKVRWKRAVAAIEDAQGEALGQLYVARYFPPERKARVQVLVRNLLAAYQQSIDKLDWMSPATRKQAQAKLAKFTPKIGYPDKWRDYSALTVVPGDLVGNVMRARAFEVQRNLNKLGKPIDRGEWVMTPQTINAYYNPEMNEIVFPAAILQEPSFEADADDAANYGGIGAVIGHEISHGFDDQGAQYDGDGNLRNWWTAADRRRFAAKTRTLVAQYNAFEALPGYRVNGALTLGENIADNAGLAIAYKAYRLSLHGQPAPVIDGMTGDQRFYMGWAQDWCSKQRDAATIVQLKSDPHAPSQFRTNGTLRNQPAFYDAFGVKPGDPMYLAPTARVIIW